MIMRPVETPVSHEDFKTSGRALTGWFTGKLGDIVEINKESVDPTRSLPDKKFLYIDIDSVGNGTGIIGTAKEILGKDAPSRARRVIHHNDVLMSTVRPYLKAFAIVPREYDNQVCSTGFAVLTSKKQVLPLYLLYTLFTKSVIEQCQKMMRGGQYPALNASQIAGITIPLPPLPEQQKIAEILLTVDEAIGKVDEAIGKSEKLKQGLMHRLFTKGIGHKEFKKTEIGKVPKAWEVSKLEDVLEICQYGLSLPMNDTGQYPIIKMDDIDNGRVVSHKVKYVNLDDPTFRAFKLEKGDILFNRTNSYELVGRTVIFLLDGKYVFASYLIRLRVNKGMLDPHFLTFYMIYSGDRLRRMASRAVHQANINASNLKRFVVIVPPLEEQRKIVETLNAVDEKLELLSKKKGQFEKIKRALMNDLLTGKKRV
jgi:type I restriction enzyme S subunit